MRQCDCPIKIGASIRQKLVVVALLITRPESIFPVGIFVMVPAQFVFIVTGHLKTNPELQRLEKVIAQPPGINSVSNGIQDHAFNLARSP